MTTQTLTPAEPDTPAVQFPQQDPDLASQCSPLGDELSEAEHLFEQGHARAAAMLARFVLGRQLFSLCERRGCLPRRPQNRMGLISQLLQTGYFSSESKRPVIRAIETGNTANHNEVIHAARVREMLAITRALVDSADLAPSEPSAAEGGAA